MSALPKPALSIAEERWYSNARAIPVKSRRYSDILTLGIVILGAALIVLKMSERRKKPAKPPVILPVRDPQADVIEQAKRRLKDGDLLEQQNPPVKEGSR